MAQLAITYGPDDQDDVGRRLPHVRLADGGDLFDIITPGQPLVLHLDGAQAAPLTCKSGVAQAILADNHYFRIDPARASGPCRHPVDKAELSKLPKAVRILVRPDGYIAAIDRVENDPNVANKLGDWGLTHG